MASAALRICCSLNLHLRRGHLCLEPAKPYALPMVLPEVKESPCVVLKFCASLSVLLLGLYSPGSHGEPDPEQNWHNPICVIAFHPSQALLDQIAWDTRWLGSIWRITSSTDHHEAMTKLRISVTLDGAVGSPMTVQCLPVPGYSMPRVCLPQLVCLYLGCFQNLLHPLNPSDSPPIMVDFFFCWILLFGCFVLVFFWWGGACRV